MAEYIEREALLSHQYNASRSHDPQLAEMVVDVRDIEDAPAADAVPLRHGRWLTTDAYPHHLYCSLCYKTYLKNAQWLDTLGVPTNFCPNCGARMEWGEKK